MITQTPDAQAQEPLKIGIAGLVHSHVHWLLGREDRGDIRIVGIAEPDRALAQRYAEQYGFSMDLVYDSLDELLKKAKPEAVCAFTSIRDHLEVVQKCAPKGVHVMVEKPLALNVEQAQQMAALARQHKVQLLTNYETSWYGSNQRIFRMVHEQRQLGDVKKTNVYAGHQGPNVVVQEPEFLNWLTDPEQNGGGALMDFGCYGANLITWMMKGEKPESVTAVVQNLQLEEYPRVEDDATIVLRYPQAQGVIQASWNWPYNRKEMEVYCEKGAVFSLDAASMRLITPDHPESNRIPAPKVMAPFNDPFAYLEAVVRGRIKVQPTDLSALENNLTVMEILDAARRSAETGETVRVTYYQVKTD